MQTHLICEKDPKQIFARDQRDPRNYRFSNFNYLNKNGDNN